MQAQRSEFDSPEPTQSLAWKSVPDLSLAMMMWEMERRITGSSRPPDLEYTLWTTKKPCLRKVEVEDWHSRESDLHACYGKPCIQADYTEVYMLWLNVSVKCVVCDYAQKTTRRLGYACALPAPWCLSFARVIYSWLVWLLLSSLSWALK